jgi:predicted amidohydrolase
VTAPAPWRIALCQYAPTEPPDFGAYCRKIARLVDEAAAAGAKLLLFPEYASLELVALVSREVRSDPGRQLQALQPFLAGFREVFRTQSRAHGLYVVAPSFPVESAGGFVNRAYLFAPEGDEGFQDKIHLTRFEQEQFGISPGAGLTVFRTALGCLAVAICYDIELPTVARSQSEAGARLILVPSCTDTLKGHGRVRIGAQARALENQCLVATAPIVGAASWSPALDVNTGAAALFAPPDRGYPFDGVLAQGALNQPAWVYAEIDFGPLESLQHQAEVFLRRQWHASPQRVPAVSRDLY